MTKEGRTTTRVVIYTKVPCPFCTSAKRLLRSKEVPFEEIDVTDDPALQQEVVQRSGRRTVPQVFVDGEPVGGFEELQTLNETGDLDRLLGAG